MDAETLDAFANAAEPGLPDPGATLVAPPLDDLLPMPGAQADEDAGDYVPEADASAAQLPTHIASQEQWDALPRWQKDLINLQRSGVQVTQAYAAKYALDAMKADHSTFTPTITLVDDPQNPGKKISVLMTSKNSATQLQKGSGSKLETQTGPDGTLLMVDTVTGKTFPAWDQETGKPIKVRVPGQGAKLDDVAQANVTVLDGKLAQLDTQITDLTGRVARGDRKLAGFGSGYDGDLRAAQAQKSEIEKQRKQIFERAGVEPGEIVEEESTAEPSATPAPTATAAPSPTPSQTPNPVPTPRPAESGSETMTAAEASKKAGRAIAPGRYRDASGRVLVVTQ